MKHFLKIITTLLLINLSIFGVSCGGGTGTPDHSDETLSSDNQGSPDAAGDSSASSENVTTEEPVVVDPEIIEKFEEESRVDILIELKEPVGLHEEQFDLEKWQEAVEKAQEKLASQQNSLNFEITDQYDSIFMVRASVNAEGLEQLAETPDVKILSLVKQNIFLHRNSSFPLIDVPIAQNISNGGNGVGIAIVDTGIDYNHSEFGSCSNVGDPGCLVVGGIDTINSDNDPDDDHGHGTHVASTAAGANGIATNANLVAVKIFGPTGNTTNAALANGLNWVVANQNNFNIRIVNMSLGDQGQYNNANTCASMAGVFNAAVNAVAASGITMFASSGNEGWANGIAYPACHPDVISVGAVSDIDQITGFTNMGGLLDILAPGLWITAARAGGGLINMSGTSMASPHAAGVAALMLDMDNGLNTNQIRNTLQTTGSIISDGTWTVPRIDAFAAVQAATPIDDEEDDDDTGDEGNDKEGTEEHNIAAILQIVNFILGDE